MTEILRLVRVFLASPGDLQKERCLVKETEEELNGNGGIAAHLGFRVELKGWEDTLSASGRPQAIINQELDRCELFIGMMYRKWGTPPSIDGPYSSGFEEEFEHSSLRRKKTGKLEMALYFKKIASTFLADPGEDLKKVLAFKDRIASERSILYEYFDEPHDLQKRVRQKIQQYLIDLKKAEQDSQEEEQAKTKKPTEFINKTQDKEPIKSPFSAEGYSFLKSFLEKTKAENSTKNITSFEVARFRLLSSTLSKSGNDEPYFGVHDANILYNSNQIKFGSREISRLIDCGLKNFKHENVPLWHWYSLYKDTIGDNFLPFKSFSNEDDVSVGALEAMKLIGTSLPIKGDFERKFFIEFWLSEDNSDNIKIAALRYLKRHGKDEDLPLIQSELNRADSKTSRIALEAIISIQLRYNKGKALNTAFTNQFESFDETLLEEVLSVSSNIDEETLRLGLKHRNNRVRLESFKRLRETHKIHADELQELEIDPFAKIRKEVVESLLSNNQPLNDKEIKKILVKPQKRGGLLGFFESTNSDEEGQVHYDEYLFSKYSKMSENELLEIIREEGIIFDDIPYLALCSRYFKNHSEELRENIDDQFKGKFESYIEYFKNIGTSDEAIKKTRNLEDFLRRRLTRKALDILCKKGDAKDLDRIRKNMRSEYVKSSEDEIEYMRKLGEWEDVPFIVKAEKDYTSSRSSLTAFSIDYDWYFSIAKAVYSIGKDRLDELLKMEMQPRILVDLITICPSSKFTEIPDETLLMLLNSKEDKVRKFASLKSVQSLNKSKLESLLKEYVGGQKYRYYNVIFWLDFGVSLPKSTTRKTIKLNSDE